MGPRPISTQPDSCSVWYVTGAKRLYFRPQNLTEAVEMLAACRGQVLAGGTDFFPALGDRPVAGPLIDLSGVTEIKGIGFEPDYIRIGGLTTWSEVIASALPRCCDALKSAAREVGSVQIQNRGTVAGNLCNASPAADGVPPLLALDAEVELASTTGTRRLLLRDFIVGNRETVRRRDEILTAVLIPRSAEQAASVFLKLGARRYLVISITMVAAVIMADPRGTISHARVAVGSCSVRAQRLEALERTLLGIPARAGLGFVALPEHLATLSPIDDLRATAAYRRDASLTLVGRALEASAESGRPC